MSDRSHMVNVQRQIMDLIFEHTDLPRTNVLEFRLECDASSYPTLEVKYLVEKKDETKTYKIKNIELEIEE